MKLHFEPDLDYQRDAIAAVCNLFRGQEVCRTEFTVTKTWRGQQFDWTEGSLGVGNRLTVLDDQLLDNLRDIHANFAIIAPSYCGIEQPGSSSGS